MKIGVVGANSFIGSQLVEEILKSGFQVVVLGRSSPYVENNLAVQFVFCDLLNFDIEALKLGVNDIDVLVNCAAELSDESNMIVVNTVAPQKLFELAKLIGARFVHISSIGVYENNHRDTVTEETNYGPVNEYEKTKLQGDLALIKSNSLRSSDLIILRPSNVFGAKMNNRSLFELIQIIDRRLFFFVGSEKAIANYLHVKDLANAVLCVINKKTVNKVVYNISNQIYFLDFVGIISFCLGKKPPRIRLPARFVLFASWLSGLYKVSPLTKSRVEQISTCADFSSGRFKKEFNWKPEVKYVTALNEIVKVYQNEIIKKKG